jgi:RNA polymerase sigma factor for flagellar operon FliA
MSRKALKVNATEIIESQKGTLQGEALLTRNIELVRRIAHRLFRRRNYVAVDDLIQAGMIGLLEAIRGHEQRAPGSFEAYASLRIREAMLDFVRKSDWSRRSVRMGPRSPEAEAKTASRKTPV